MLKKRAWLVGLALAAIMYAHGGASALFGDAPPESVPVLYEPEGERPAKPARPAAPVEPEYESVGIDLDALYQRHLWDRQHSTADLDENGEIVSEVSVSIRSVEDAVGEGNVSVTWNDDGSVDEVTISDSDFYLRYLPLSDDGDRPLIMAFMEQRQVIAQQVIFDCRGRQLQFYPSYAERYQRFCDLTDDQVATYIAQATGSGTVAVWVGAAEQMRLDNIAAGWWNLQVEARLIALQPSSREAEARNAAKRAAFNAEIAAYQVLLDAYQQELADWREAMAPWTDYEEEVAAQDGMFVNCAISGCALENAVR